MHTEPHLAQKHNLTSELAFRVKICLLTINRGFKNIFTHRLSRSTKNNELDNAPVIASSESDLWNVDDNDNNWILTAGKVENLRIAASKLDGIEVKAGSVFSFWQHVGIPSRRRGFVIGREIREGCIVPTIAGGLCQLSNALYDAALQAGFQIVERHRHTRVIKGSLAEQGRDAAVKWNYVDLRFKPTHNVKITIGFTADKMIVQFKSNQNISLLPFPGIFIGASKLNDCYSCGNIGCFKHVGNALNIQKQVTTYILDEKWPEYLAYVRSNSSLGDHFIIPFTMNSKIKIARYSWPVDNTGHSTTFALTALMRALAIRRAAKKNGKLPLVHLKYDAAIINAIKSAIPIKTTHIVISQNLLPFAWQQGILWGRTFDVLMTRLPMELLQSELDNAHLLHRDSKTLNDLRVGKALTDMENSALTRARRIVTPHVQIANIFNNKSIKLHWALPQLNKIPLTSGNKILFPASALARKGAFEVKQLVKELNIPLVVAGRALENDGFWDDLNITYAGPDIFEDIKLVILPAYIENQPRLLLKALALNIPVIATVACGISCSQGQLTLIPRGNYQALKHAVECTLCKKEIK